jgi:4-hydroxybenzoyl-CoA reductase subunit beta
MLRLPLFGLDTPTDLAGVVAALRVPGTRLVAGGTDLLPNLKHRLAPPQRLVSLAAVAELRAWSESEEELRLGAGLTLAELAADPRIAELFPSLGRAAGLVASPLIRNSATLGGNVNLDTRCRYVNQTDLWRSAIGGCLKSEGHVCHVVPGGRNCVAAMSSDTVPVLISLGASVELLGPAGSRTLLLEDYFQADGTRHTVRADDEVTTAILVPKARRPRRTAYAKWSVRRSIDFPLVSIALRFDLEEDHAGAPVADAVVVVGVLGAKPRRVGRLEGLRGHSLSDPAVAARVGDAVYDQCKPLENVPYEAGYRRRMLRVYARRAVEALAAGAA